MSDDLLSIEINGTECKARPGSMIIEVADQAGILIPRFCYHKKLSVAANCRMCLVEVEKAPKPLPACATPIMEGMKVSTKSAYAIQAQKSVMEFLLINHPLDCPICDQGGECELQDVAMGYGRDVSRFNERKRVVEDKNLGPLIATDMTRCIHCTRCVRFGDEVAGLPELGSTGRSEDLEIGTFIERNMESELSGNVIDVCPVGALTSKPFRYRARAWEIMQRDSVSPHDGVGSNLHVHIKQGEVVRVVPRENDAINEVWISDRDRFSYQGLYSEDRLKSPRVKQGGEWLSVDWETALDAAADGIKRVIREHGAQVLGALCSASSTVEEAFLFQKLARELGSGNVDHRLRQEDFSDQSEAPAMPWLGQSITDLAESDVTLLVGCDCRREQPMANHRLRQSVLKGGQVLAINPLDYDFNYEVAAKIITDPHGMIEGLAGVAQALDGAGLRALVKGTKAHPVYEEIATRLREAQSGTVILGAIAASHPHAASIRALAGHIAETTGASFGYLQEGANSAGVWMAGAVPHRGVGGTAATVVGSTAQKMLSSGQKAWLTLGVEPELDCLDSGAAMAAFSEAAFVVSLTPYVSDSMRAYAKVLLPIAPFVENEGTFINIEGRWQSFSAAVPPQGEARPAWKVLRVLGNLLELPGFDYVDVKSIGAEVREFAGDQLPSNLGAWRVPDALPTKSGSRLSRVGDMPIYSVDGLVRRAPALQATSHAADAAIGIHPRLAERLRLSDGDHARARQNGFDVTLRVVVDAAVPEDCVHLRAGLPGSVGLGASFGAIEIEKA